MNPKNVLSQILAFVSADPSLIVGALASLVVLGASDLHIVISHASAVAILAPFITTVLAALDKKVGAVKSVLPAKKTAS